MNAFVQWIKDWVAQPRRTRETHDMAGQIDAALTELKGAVDEVAGEFDTLSDQLASGELSAEDAATQIREQATRLRNINPETPAQPDPVDEGDVQVNPGAPGVADPDNNVQG